jgi:hypothetical protein
LENISIKSEKEKVTDNYQSSKTRRKFDVMIIRIIIGAKTAKQNKTGGYDTSNQQPHRDRQRQTTLYDRGNFRPL